MPIPRSIVTAVATAGALAVAGCGQGESVAPPEPGEGAVGMVDVDNAGAAQNPKTPALSGGPEGQTPDPPSAAGAPSVIYSGPAAAPTSASSDAPHVGR